MKNRYNHPIFEFRGEVLEILDTKKGRFIFTFKAEGYTRVLNFMLTAAVDHYRGMIEPGERVKKAFEAIAKAAGHAIENPSGYSGFQFRNEKHVETLINTYSEDLGL